MYKCMIFGGTLEGRKIAEFCIYHKLSVILYVATEYGRDLLPDNEYLSIHTGRLTGAEMFAQMKREEVSMVIDATHPYAVEVTANVLAACKLAELPYLRCIRSGKGVDCIPDSVIHMDSVETAAEYLRKKEGSILITTGSKELEKFCNIDHYRERIFARVLPDAAVITHCKELGIYGRHLIAMQGPFSETLNRAMLLETGAKYLVTKEAGFAGGLNEKIDAAIKEGIIPIVIGRPTKEEGLDRKQIEEEIAKQFGIKQPATGVVSRNIWLVGTGMGCGGQLTQEALNCIKESQAIIGSKRMLESVKTLGFGKKLYNSYDGNQIKQWLTNQRDVINASVLLSGDVGFYSGAKNIAKVLAESGFANVKMIPGISSAIYFCAKLQIPWEDVKLLSLHGRETNVLAQIRSHSKVFLLAGKENSIQDLCKSLLEAQLTDLNLWVGESLSYPNEHIINGTPKEIGAMNFNSLSSVIIENPNPIVNQIVTHGIEDSLFMRGKVPMTKSEIRSISLSKLKLTAHSIVYDIGAGTGSVAVEAALQADFGRVYAIEKNPEAIGLIYDNKRKFAVSNLSIITGTAPGACSSLESPTHAFIGGSSGNLNEILELLLFKNKEIRIVFNAITLETLTEIMEWLKMYPSSYIDIVQISVSKSETIGGYHMMRGTNPIYVITFQGGCAHESEKP